MTEQDKWEKSEMALREKWELFQDYLDNFDPTPQYLYDNWETPMDFDDFCISLEEEQILTNTNV